MLVGFPMIRSIEYVLAETNSDTRYGTGSMSVLRQKAIKKGVRVMMTMSLDVKMVSTPASRVNKRNRTNWFPFARFAALEASHSKKPDSSSMAERKVIEKKRTRISRGFMAVGAVRPSQKLLISSPPEARRMVAPNRGGIQNVSIEKRRKESFG